MKNFIKLTTYKYSNNSREGSRVVTLIKKCDLIVSMNLIEMIIPEEYDIKEYNIKEGKFDTQKKQLTKICLSSGYKSLLTDMTVDSIYNILEPEEKRRTVNADIL